MARRSISQSNEVPAWLQDLMQIDNRPAFRKALIDAVMPRWEAIHSDRPRAKGGRPSLQSRVWTACENIWPSSSRNPQEQTLVGLLADVEANLRSSNLDSKPPSALTIHKHVVTWLLKTKLIGEIPRSWVWKLLTSPWDEREINGGEIIKDLMWWLFLEPQGLYRIDPQTFDFLAIEFQRLHDEPHLRPRWRLLFKLLFELLARSLQKPRSVS
jgi:hypothetical protein